MQRKKPFSGKKKKEQLKERRARKAEASDRAEGNVHKNIEKEEEEDNEEDRDIEEEDTTSHSEEDNSNEDNNEKKNKKKKKGNNSNILTPETVIIPKERFPRNKLVTIFEKETKEEVEERRRKGYLPLNLYHRDHPWWENIESETVLEMPKRPSWAHSMSPDLLEENERKNYEQWMRQLLQQYGPRLNYFEKNLEVWRQLWRVVERSDVILLVVDARFPLFHYPPSLYDYVVKELKKPIILVLNKADIVDKRIVDAWEDYFLQHFPSLSVVRFSSFRPMAEGALEIEKKRKLEKGRRKYENAGGRRTLLEAVRSLNIKKNGKIVDIPELTFVPSQNDDDDEDESDDDDSEAEEVDEEEEKKRDYDSVITIGTVGHPNVGKSSLINGLVGKKVVSTSRTPGHTKHFQTIFLTPEILLCDCPGLVFPALDRPKDLQVLCGVFPIAQVREVFSAIRYLAERVPIEKVYNLKPPEDNEPWSPYNICESYATKRGYLVARTGAPDVHRAGGEILKDCLDGNIVISWPPPGRSDILLPTPAPETDDAKIKGDDDSEDSDGEPKNSFRENQKKKREKKMKKKQKALDGGEEDEKPKKTAVTGKPKPKKPAKKQDDDDDKPSYYEKMEAKAKRSNKHQTLGEL